jgi:hypothetical protein
MRIYTSPFVIVDEPNALWSCWRRRAETGTFPHLRSSPRVTHFFHIMVLLMPSRPIRFLLLSMREECCAVMASPRQLHSRLYHSIA